MNAASVAAAYNVIFNFKLFFLNIECTVLRKIMHRDDFIADKVDCLLSCNTRLLKYYLVIILEIVYRFLRSSIMNVMNKKLGFCFNYGGNFS